jgi:hypothetical protein
MLWKDGPGKKAIFLAGWSLLLVLPAIAYVLKNFAPTSPTEFAEAEALLVHLRVPHHAVPAVWFDGFAVAQIVWMLVGLFLARGNRLFPILSISLAVGIGLTLLQLATGSDSLALLFPWRLSIYLVPIATALVLTRIVLWLAPPVVERVWLIRSIQTAVVLVLFLSGIGICWTGLGYRSSADERRMMDFVRDHKSPGDLYLIPTDMPTGPTSNRSPMSMHFQKDAGTGLIPIELQTFRLYTGAPIFVDFKAIPYRDVEVLEWRHRLLLNRQFYEHPTWPNAAWTSELAQYGVTHIVTRAEQVLSGEDLKQIYRDDHFRVYRVTSEPTLCECHSLSAGRGSRGK